MKLVKFKRTVYKQYTANNANLIIHRLAHEYLGKTKTNKQTKKKLKTKQQQKANKQKPSHFRTTDVGVNVDSGVTHVFFYYYMGYNFIMF